MKHIIYQVDSFTNKAFYGNPAGVCVLTSPMSDGEMRKIAAEMAVSETAFAWPEENGFRLRWFTPTVEVELCGHGTLAAAHILFEKGIVSSEVEIHFHTLSGLLKARMTNEGVEMDFPSFSVDACETNGIDFEQILGAAPVFVGKMRDNFFVELESDEAVMRLEPNLSQIAKLNAHSLVVSAPSSKIEFDFVSRNFAPAVGIDEDPVTGSAHCALAPYYAPRLNKSKMVGYQASRRGGIVRVQINGDRIILAGNAVTVLEGTLIS